MLDSGPRQFKNVMNSFYNKSGFPDWFHGQVASWFFWSAEDVTDEASYLLKFVLQVQIVYLSCHVKGRMSCNKPKLSLFSAVMKSSCDYRTIEMPTQSYVV